MNIFVISVVLIVSSLAVVTLLVYKFKKNMEKELRERDKFLSALHKLYGIMVSLVNLEETAQKLTDAIAFELGFQAGVLSLIDEKTNSLKRVAVSHTPAGLIGIRMLPVPYKNINIPLNRYDNILVKAIHERKPQITNRMYDLFVPNLAANTIDNLQRLMNIRTSFVYPIYSRDKVIGAMIFSISGEEKEISLYQRDAISKIIEVVGLVINRVYLYEELERTSQSLSVANQKLKEMDMLKDEFVSVASHELRTPMTAIRSYVWMALHKSDIPLSQKLQKYLYRTLISTERLINLVSDMLNLSRIESGKIEINPISLNLVELIKDIVEDVKIKATEKKLNILILEQKLPQVFADPEKVQQILLNLLGNALKFTFPGGTISISFFTDGSMVEISVKDSGQGISPDDMGKLFKKFSRLDQSYVSLSTSGGTGLGLYISKNLVELMGGKIRANSEGEGKGTTFTFSLPVASSQILEHPEQFHVRAKGEAKGLEPVAI